jgi:hypothetical protein
VTHANVKPKARYSVFARLRACSSNRPLVIQAKPKIRFESQVHVILALTEIQVPFRPVPFFSHPDGKRRGCIIKLVRQSDQAFMFVPSNSPFLHTSVCVRANMPLLIDTRLQTRCGLLERSHSATHIHCHRRHVYHACPLSRPSIFRAFLVNKGRPRKQLL